MAMNTPYKRVDLNVNPNYASMAQKDPWFALGYALGQGYWNNYNARGERKSIDIAREKVADYLKNMQPAPQGLVDQAMTLSVGGNTVSEDSVKKASNGDGKGTIKPEVDHSLLKWDYTTNKYKDSPNPVGDTIATQTVVNDATKVLDNINIGALNEVELYDKIKTALVAQNKGKHVEAAINAIRPMVEQKKAEYNNKVVDQLYGLYMQANKNGDHANAERFALQISQLNPTMGKHLLGGTVTYKDRWQQENREKIAAIRASGKGSRRGSGNGNYLNSTNKSDLERAAKIKANPDSYRPEDVEWANKIDDRINRFGVSGLDLDDAYAVSDYLERVWDEAVLQANSTGLGAEKIAAQILNKDGFLSRHPYARETIEAFREESGIPLYLPSDFGEGGTWMSSGEDDDYNASGEEVGVLGPVAEEQNLRLTTEKDKDSLVAQLEKAKDEYIQENGFWNLAKMTADANKKK